MRLSVKHRAAIVAEVPFPICVPPLCTSAGGVLMERVLYVAHTVALLTGQKSGCYQHVSRCSSIPVQVTSTSP